MNGTTRREALDARSPEARTLHLRILELEREAADARDRAELLLALQAAFERIAIARNAHDVIAHMLRATRRPLGFARGLYFDVENDLSVRPTWQVDGGETLEPNTESLDAGPGGSIAASLRRGLRDAVGRASDLTAPLVDVRSWYALSVLSSAGGPIGVLYVDGHQSTEPRAWEVGLLNALTTIASIAIDNGLLLARTHDLAMRDPLTGLLNRRAFTERLHAELEACRRSERSVTYVMIDVDDFKAINDSHGHAYGDAILRRVGETLTSNSRAHDVVGRYAGDEFVVLLTNIEPDRAYALVARLSSGLRAAGVACSLGAAAFPNDARDAAALLTAADAALYRTKANGKNGFSFARTP